MGYYATGSGSICIATTKTSDIKTLLRSYTSGIKTLLRSYTGVRADVFYQDNCAVADFIFDNCLNYDDEGIEDLLNEISGRMPVVCGEIRFRGEDDEHWRFLWHNNTWVKQFGEIVYPDLQQTPGTN